MSSMTRNFILVLMAGVWNVQGKAFLKQRLSILEPKVNILEIRMNSIEQDIVTLNASFINREDLVCECSNAKAENDGPIKQNFEQSVVASKQSETRIRKGLMDEKKWVRQKVKHVENEMHKVVNQIVEDNKNANAEMVRKMQSKENDMDRKLNVAIAEVTKNCRDEIANQEENNENTTAEILTKVQTIENEQDRKLNVAITEVTKNYSDKIANQEENNKGSTADIMTKIQAMVNDIAEISRKVEKFDEQQVEIDDLKQKIKENIPCPDGWTRFQSFCYLYVKEEKYYDSARETCLNLGASVADIESSSENDFIYKFCEDNGYSWTGDPSNLWIGFSDEETEGVWISDRTRETSAYMNWRSGQPDEYSGDQDCIIMGYKSPYDQWNDVGCSNHCKFVCKKKLPYM